MNITEKLDRLADFHFQKDSIDAQKRALLDDVKVPAEIQALATDILKRIDEIEKAEHAADASVNATIERNLAAVVIPEEIKAALAEIDRQRAAIQDERRAYNEATARRISEQIQAIKAETDGKVKDVYAAIEQRRREIEEEFFGKTDDVDRNIAALEAEIKAEVKVAGQTVKGAHFMAVYVKGRTSWNNDMLDGMIALVPQLEKARKVGEPSISIRAVQ